MDRRSLMAYSPSKVPSCDHPRSVFDFSHRHASTADMGYLIPILVSECYPGDTHYIQDNVFIRLLSPLKAPFLDNVKYETFYFYERNRQLWEHWQNFCGELDGPSNLGTEYHVPQLNTGEAGVGPQTLADYFGIPLGAVDTDISALPFRMYYKLVNEWFLDQDIDEPFEWTNGDSGDEFSDFTLQRRRKKKDYFTSCRPWMQKGTEVSIAGTGQAPVIGNGYAIALYDGVTKYGMYSYGADNQIDSNAFGKTTGATITATAYPANYTAMGAPPAAAYSNDMYKSGLVAHMEEAQVIPISNLRYSLAIQEILERNARHGSRYVEYLYAQWGVVSSDALQYRVEFLGSGYGYVSINTVVQNENTYSATSTIDRYAGQLSAFGVGKSNCATISKSIEEHGLIIGLLHVTVDLYYQQGLDRFWKRYDTYDFMLPGLCQLSEQPVYNYEIYACGNPTTDNTPHGYNEYGADLRQKFNRLSGLLRSDVTGGGSLDYWHCGIDYSAAPGLNTAFIEDNPPFDRNVFLPLQPHYFFDVFFNYQCARRMPTFSVPAALMSRGM